MTTFVDFGSSFRICGFIFRGGVIDAFTALDLTTVLVCADKVWETFTSTIGVEDNFSRLGTISVDCCGDTTLSGILITAASVIPMTNNVYRKCLIVSIIINERNIRWKYF